MENPDDLVMMLQECFPLHRQRQLARIMECPLLCTEMVLQVFYDRLFPRDLDLDEY